MSGVTDVTVAKKKENMAAQWRTFGILLNLFGI